MLLTHSHPAACSFVPVYLVPASVPRGAPNHAAEGARQRRGWGQPPHQPVTPASSVTPASQARAVAQSTPALLGCPAVPEGRERNHGHLGKKLFFFVLFCFPASGTAQPAPASGCAVAWHSQLSRQCHCTGKGLGPVPKCPSALRRAVRLETSTSSARPPVWGLPCVSVCSRNGKLSAALVGLSPHSLPLTVLALLSQKHNPADVGYPPLPLVLLFSSAASLLIASALALSTDPKEPECSPLGSGKGFGCG